jgi:hypothetical protein
MLSGNREHAVTDGRRYPIGSIEGHDSILIFHTQDKIISPCNSIAERTRRAVGIEMFTYVFVLTEVRHAAGKLVG